MRIKMTVAAIAAVLSLAGPPATVRAADDDLVYFLTPESETLFETASETGDFYPLIARFVSETRQTFCGIASSVMVLNALEITPPVAPQWYPSQYWDEDNIFTLPVLEKVASVQQVEGGGITLDQLEVLLETNGATVDRVFAGDTDLDAFRKAAIAALADPNAYLVVNVSRALLGQGGVDGGGHISPVAAYNAEADRFLFLDVARYKYLPSWITAERLYAAMNTIDTTSKKTRGYVVVRK
jgi:hypothetical protein